MAFLGFYPQRSTASDLGQSLGSGLGKGLSALAEAKLQKLQTAQAEKDFINEGYDRNSAKLFSRIMHDPAFKNNPQLLKLIQGYQVPQFQDQGENQNQVAERDYLEAFQHPQQPQMQQPQMQDFEQVAQSLKNPMGFAQARMGQVPFQPQMQPQQQMQQPIEQQMEKPTREASPRLRPPQFSKTLTETEKANIDIRKQNQINTQNKPFNTSLEKQVTMAKRINDTARELKRLLLTGKVYSGFEGSLAKGRPLFQNDETQQAEKLMNDLAGFRASELGGPATGLKIRWSETTKPNLNQSANTQMALTDRILGDSSEPLNIEQIRLNLIEKNGGKEPENLKGKTLARYKKIENLNPASEFDDGIEAVDEATGEVLAVVQNGEWYPL